MPSSPNYPASRPVARRLPAAAGLLLVLACTDATAPDRVPREPAVASAVEFSSTAANVAAIDDALDRIVPALDDDRRATGLRLALEALTDALTRGDATASAIAFVAARHPLDAFAAGQPTGAAADLDAIGLALAHVRATVEDLLPASTGASDTFGR